MARTGLTNFVVWALTTFVFGYFLFGDPATMFVVVSVALWLAWSTPLWPEALGVSTGVAALLFSFSFYGPIWGVAGLAVAGTTWFVWSRRTGAAAGPVPSLPNGTARPWRLIVATLIAALTIFVLDFVLALSFGFTCGSDTSQATSGSDRAAWCDALGRGDVAGAVLLGPAALVAVLGIYVAWRGRARELLIVVIAGFVLTIGVHMPDFVLSNAAP
jgi:hypothetical protein